MTDVITLIKEQHREVDKLLTKAEEQKGDVGATMRQIYDLLKPHSDAEEDFVYPTIKKKASETGDEVKDGVAEHHQIEGLFKELFKGKPGDPGYDGTVAAIAGQLRHHVQEEEEELLPALRKNSTKEELESMGERFAKATKG